MGLLECVTLNPATNWTPLPRVSIKVHGCCLNVGQTSASVTVRCTGHKNETKAEISASERII